MAYPPAGANRDEWKAQFPVSEWLTGSIDWIWEAGGVDDLKTGRYPPHPADSRQLLSYALLPWVLQSAPLDWETTVSITHWPKYPLDVKPMRTVALVTGFQLAEHLEDLRWAAVNPYTLQPSARACQYCPSRTHCEVAI